MPTYEFSRPFAVEKMVGGRADIEIEADAQERRRLARRFSILAIDTLTATIQVRARSLDLVYAVRGTLAADVVQSCVVSLEPVPARVEHAFAATFHRDPAAADTDESVVDPDDEEDPPEALVDGVIDLGELVAQHLSLALNPYPRAPGVSLADVLPSQDAGAQTPFAVLRDLSHKGDD